MARHLGLNAHFKEVDLPDTWDLQHDEGFILLRHVNTLIKLSDRSAVVVDLEMERYSPVYPQRTISDELMTAFYYNNRGMEWLAAGDVRQSFLHLRRALVSGPDRAFIWSNMAVLYRRHQLYPEAEALYLQALQVTPDDLTSISNLAGLYHLMGREDEAASLMRQAEAYRNNNPYYLYTLAQRRVREDEPEAALELVLRAIRMQDGEPRFYELAAELYEQAGDERRAATMLQRAPAAQPEQF
jgi:tetratricopeptide (TPR) repeat protein